jgi:hypothetical protein
VPTIAAVTATTAVAASSVTTTTVAATAITTTAVAATAITTTAVAAVAATASSVTTTAVAATAITASSVSEERGTVREEPPAVLRQLGLQRRAWTQALPSKEARRRLAVIRQLRSLRDWLTIGANRCFSAAWAPQPSSVLEGWGARNEHPQSIPAPERSE